MPNDGNPLAGTGTPAPAVTAPIAAPAPAATAAPPAAAVPVAAPAVVVAPAATEPPALEPSWIPERIDRARKSGAADVLKQLGVTDLAAAKAAVDAAKLAEDAKKTAEQRAAEAATAASAAQQTVTRQQALITEQAARMMMVLTPAQQKVVTDFAGEDASEQLRVIQHFAPTWSTPAQPAASPAPAAGPAAPAAATPPVASPTINTAPPPSAPPGTAPGSPPDHRAVYEQQRATNPFAAAAYGQQHFAAVYANKT